MQAELDIDSLLGAGPGASAPSHASKQSRLPFGNAARAAPARAQPVRSNPLLGRSAPTASHAQYDDSHGDDGFGDDGGDDGYTEHMTTSGAGAYTPPAATTTTSTATTAASQSQSEDAAEEAGEAAEMAESAQPKLSLSKGPRKLKASEPSKAASTGGNVWGYKPDLAASSGNNALNAFATAETAENISDVSGAAAMAAGGKIDPRTWLLHSKPAEDDATATDGGAQVDKGEEYVNLFWLDATENNGVLYLFGKLPVNDPPAVPPGASQGQSQGSQSSAGGTRRFVSCCVAIHGCERNLFVLPRLVPDTFKEDGTQARLGMADVYKELSTMLGKCLHLFL